MKSYIRSLCNGPYGIPPGAAFARPWVGAMLDGIFASRGANLVSNRIRRPLLGYNKAGGSPGGFCFLGGGMEAEAAAIQ